MSEPSLPQLVVSHWQPSAVPMLAGAGAALLYLLASSRLRARWPARRTVSFLAGVASVLVALDSGINSYDDRLLSIHMVQHLILLLIAPLLLLCGQPLLLALRALPPKRRSGLARAISRLRRLAHPLACISIFSGAVLFTHLPFFYEATLRHPDLHDAEHAIYVLAGLLLWWPVLDVDPARSRRLGGLGRLAYVLAAMPPMALIGAYLNRHVTLVYPAYGPPGRALGISAVTDQQHAGALMWVAGNTIMAAVGLWVALGALVAEERRQQAREAREARSAPAADGAAVS